MFVPSYANRNAGHVALSWDQIHCDAAMWLHTQGAMTSAVLKLSTTYPAVAKYPFHTHFHHVVTAVKQRVQMREVTHRGARCCATPRSHAGTRARRCTCYLFLLVLFIASLTPLSRKSCGMCDGNHTCLVTCERSLFCAHICGRSCHDGKGCQPCSQKCQRACNHSVCPLKCFQPVSHWRNRGSTVLV